MKNYTHFLLLSTCTLVLWSCRHETPQKAEVVQETMEGENKDVFVSGSIVRNGTRYACFWKNDTIHILNESASAAMDIFVVNDEILLGGESNGRPCYWQNGSRTMINVPGEGVVTAIQKKGDVIYAIGYVHEGPVRKRGFLLKGPELVFLNDYAGYASDFAFDGDDFYIAGTDGGRPCYWKNEAMVVLSERGDVVAIEAAHGEVIVAGNNHQNVASVYGVWKNGVFEPLADQSVQKLKMSEEQLYVLGNRTLSSGKEGIVAQGFVKSEGQQTPILGENSQSSTFVTDIFLEGATVFVLGSTINYGEKGNGRLCYWMDGRMHVISLEEHALGTALVAD